MQKKKIVNNILVFVITTAVFFCLTYFLSNKVLAAFSVTAVRPSAAMNPVLGIIFGWPAILGCTVGNFISDWLSGYLPFVCWVGLISQTLYGAIPYYIWRKYIRSTSHITRLDSPKKTLAFALVMLISTLFVGLCVGGFQYYTTHGGFWITSWFAFTNDFDMCMIFGLPLMAFFDHIYSRYKHNGKRKLSINERIILIVAAIQVVSAFAVIPYIYISQPDASFEEKFQAIFSIGMNIINILLILSVVAMYVCNIIKRKNAGVRIFEKKNGTIYVDEKKYLEAVTYPRKSIENRIKSDALGFSLENAKKIVMPSYETGWTVALSCQRGCPMKCAFCDCPAVGFHGNATEEDLKNQMELILQNNGGTMTKRFEVEFMRMGEPSLNPAILKYIEFDLRDQILTKVDAEVIVPYLSTMMPRSNKNLKNFLLEYCRIKNEVYDGNANLQLSLNSTDNYVRSEIFRNKSLPLEEIAEIAKDLPMPKGNRYLLNFAITEHSIIDAKVIDGLFDKNKFIIKLTPIHETFNAVDNGFNITSEYEDFLVFEKFEKQFLEIGWDVVSFLDSKDEDDDDLTCGHLVLSNINERMAAKPTGPKKRIGIIVAIEIDAVYKLYPTIRKLQAPPGYSLLYVERDDYDIYILQTGMGEVAASAGVQFLVSQYNVSSIVNFGVVGGLTTDMKKLKVCLVDQVVHYKYDCSEFMDLKVGQVDQHDSIYLKTSETLVKSALSIVTDLPVVTCCSGDKFIGTAEEKTYLHETFGGDICDMESAGIVLACELNRVPCILLKAVSDGLADGAEGFFAELTNASIKCLEVADKIMDKIAMTEA